jgi:hypothetical protein
MALTRWFASPKLGRLFVRDGLMRLFLIAIATLSLGAGATFAQVHERLQSFTLAATTAASAIAWNVGSGTHMTKQEWSWACKRVQTSYNLNVDAIMRGRKTPR